MRRIALVCLWLVSSTLCVNAMAQEPWPGAPDELRRVLDGYNVKPGDVGIFVQALDESEPLLDINSSAAFNPASTIKLLTTWLALTELGPEWTWPTDVYVDGEIVRGVLRGDLIIKGYGDPYLITERLWSLQRQLRLRGIRKIAGDLVIDNSYFSGEAGDPAAFDGEGLRAYNVLPDAFLVNFQALSLYFEPDPARNRIRVSADPMPANLTIDNRLRAQPGRCGGFRNGVRLELEGNSRNKLIVSGNYGIDCERYVLTRSVLRAPTYAYGVFRSLWEESGGELGGTLRVQPTALLGRADDEEPFLRIESPPLSDLIRYINKFSNNVMSRHMFLSLGADVFGEPANRDKARRATQLILQQQQLNFPELRIDNGSGLSRDARISAGSLGEVLRAASFSPWWAEYTASMSLAGLDGTLRKRFRDEAATGRMHLKTGRLSDVYATAGYVHALSGKDYAVVILQNYKDANRGPGEEAQAALLRWVYEQ
ncbi:MAG: D-alanyl-D-alanine carboxypeptidase/D-alanyl-D-alanine-endopeptidase [Gammaproteobacteria bacterium]|nr:D-alanyl-D-alanine carboxypeptidase/D-alanyl-D-alanine-endopeptidase [Gammaproteobacteria bacterium]